jgi:HEAT repeat protein
MPSRYSKFKRFALRCFFGFSALNLLFLPVAHAKLNKKEAFQKAKKVIEDSFTSPNSSIRETAVISLKDMKFPKDEVWLHTALKDNNEYVRIAAALSLAAKKDMTGLVVLQDILENTTVPPGGNPILVQFQAVAVAKKRSAAATAIGHLGDLKGKPLLVKARRDQDGRVRDAVSVGLALLGEKTELSFFHTALGDKDEGVRQASMEALAEAANPDSEEFFVKGLTDPVGVVRLAALKGLKNLNQDSVWRDVAALLRDDDALVRESAAEILGLFGNKQAVSALKLLLQDENGFARLAAAKALGRLGDRSGTEILRQFLVETDADVRVKAVEGFGVFTEDQDWGQVAPLLDDPEERVRLAAAVVLWKKGGLRS